LRVVRLDNFDQIQDYGVDWNELVSSSLDNHVFLTSEWLTTWWKHYGKNRELILLALEDDGKICSVAPLMGSTFPAFGMKLKRIEFMGSPASDYHTFIISNPAADKLNLILEYVKQNFRKYDCVELIEMPEESKTYLALKQAQKAYAMKEANLDNCPYVPLSGTFEEYLKTLSSNRRQLLGRWERKLMKEHRVGYRLFSDPSTVEEGMLNLFDLHQKSKVKRGLKGLFADETFRNFHLEIAKVFAAKNLLFLGGFTLDDKPISSEYGFIYDGKLYYYLNDYDPVYAQYGVGNLGTKYVFKTCFERGLREVDFMRGGEEYKQHWKTVNRRNVMLYSVKWKLTPRAYYFARNHKSLFAFTQKLINKRY
jgi:CelD/BcsL family acetyltransferase involved in cellulose biosynthesis